MFGFYSYIMNGQEVVMIREQDFLRYITVNKSLSSNSIRGCLTRFRIYIGWLRVEKQIVSKESVQNFLFSLKQKGLRNNSLNTYVFFFRYLQDFLKHTGEDIDVLGDLKSFRKEKPVIIVLTTEEIERILDTHIQYKNFRGKDTSYLDEMYLIFTRFLACTGCRFDEAASLRVKYLDISASRAMFIQTKNKDIRYAYFTNPLSTLLAGLIKDKAPEELVFTNAMNHKIHPQDYISKDLKVRALQAGITKRVHPHLFRHSFATALLESGVGIEVVANILGHKDIQTTFSNYAHLADKTLRLGTQNHPLVRLGVAPIEYVEQIKLNLAAFRLDEDPRFDRSKISTAVHIFIESLYSSIQSVPTDTVFHHT